MELRVLVALPVFISVALIFGYVSLYKPAPSSEHHLADLSVRPPEISESSLSNGNTPHQFGPSADSDTCSCPTDTIADDCRNTAYPVMGGLDFVQYFTAFKNSDGTYDETRVGSVGSKAYSFVYNGYTFYFLSEENLKLFSSAPESYVPQYGGFCSWGIAGETCPPYAWSADCLGPSGSYSHWTIAEGKLYFFKSSSPKAKFTAATSDYVITGDGHWNSWFDKPLEQFSTQCYSM